MSVYAIIDVDVVDREGFAEYVKGHAPTMEPYGGRFLVAGGSFEKLEGDWSPRLLVLQEWPSREKFHAWYHSEAYRPFKELRKRVARTNVILVDGVPVT